MLGGMHPARQTLLALLSAAIDKWQANFEWRVVGRGPWLGNGHLDIMDLP